MKKAKKVFDDPRYFEESGTVETRLYGGWSDPRTGEDTQKFKDIKGLVLDVMNDFLYERGLVVARGTLQLHHSVVEGTDGTLHSETRFTAETTTIAEMRQTELFNEVHEFLCDKLLGRSLSEDQAKALIAVIAPTAFL